MSEATIPSRALAAARRRTLLAAYRLSYPQVDFGRGCDLRFPLRAESFPDALRRALRDPPESGTRGAVDWEERATAFAASLRAACA